MLYVSNTPFYNWLKPLLINLASIPIHHAKELLSLLKNIDNDLRSLPVSVEEMSYDKSPDRYWFWRLDYYLWEQKEQFFKNAKELEIVGDYVFRANRSLEHLHPQHQDNNDEWPTECIHSFGNLAMYFAKVSIHNKVMTPLRLNLLEFQTKPITMPSKVSSYIECILMHKERQTGGHPKMDAHKTEMF